VQGRFAIDDAAQVTAHIAEVLRLLSAQPVSPPAVLAEVVHLLAQLPSAMPVVTAGHRPPARIVSIACARLIDAALDEPITLDHLADELHLTKHHLVRTFTADFGVPPLTYLAARRLDVAAHLVTTTDRGIADIASAVGLTDANYFSRRFKQRFGLTPTAYRTAQVAGPVVPRSDRRPGSRAADA
jgi:AraC family transcriptional regulator of adaptative response / methylphosphotriester-DNA alkyltransferase methyltransferase